MYNKSVYIYIYIYTQVLLFMYKTIFLIEFSQNTPLQMIVRQQKMRYLPCNIEDKKRGGGFRELMRA